MKDYDSIRCISRGKFTYAKFAKLKELAKNTVGYHDDNTDLLISTYVSLYNYSNDKIVPIDKQISTIIKELNPSILSIPGIGEITAASIISEYGDISCFSSCVIFLPDSLLSWLFSLLNGSIGLNFLCFELPKKIPIALNVA